MKTDRVHPLLFFVLIWPLGMGVLGVVLALFLSATIQAPARITFFLTIFSTLSISFWPVFVSMAFLAAVRKKMRRTEKKGGRPFSSVPFFGGYSFAVVAAALWGDVVSRSFLEHLFDPAILLPGSLVFKLQWIPSILLSLLISWPFYFLQIHLLSREGTASQKMERGTGGVDPNGSDALEKAETLDSPDSLRILIQRQEWEVPFAKIIYLTAFDKKCILHSLERDLEISETLKSIFARFPKNRFLRIHKSFAVHLAFVGRLEHVNHGSYRLVLKDEDETALPVGRAYLGDLRRVLRLRDGGKLP